jgi:hypothetical protein
MTKGAYTLSDIAWPMVRLYCLADQARAEAIGKGGLLASWI